MRTPLNIIIEQQVKKILASYMKIIPGATPIAISAPLEADINLQRELTENVLTPVIISLFMKRLISGCEPVKIATNKLYISPGIALFTEDEPSNIDPATVNIPAHINDRWLWVYLKRDRTYTVNKYPPFLGSNQEYIPICKVWKEAGSLDFDGASLRDIRPVGFASFSIQHRLRQVFLNLFLGIPATIVNIITVAPHGGMNIKIGSVGDKILYSLLNFIPNTVLTIPTPLSGTKDYYVIASAQVDNYDPDDFVWNFKTKEITESLSVYEIPLAIVYGVTNTTTTITAGMIKKFGIQKMKSDYFNEVFTFKKEGAIDGSITEIDVPQPISYLGKINKLSLYLKTLALNTGQNLKIHIFKNNVIIYTVTFSTSDNGNNIVKNYELNEKVFPEDYIKVEVEEVPFVAGSEASNLCVKVLVSKA